MRCFKKVLTVSWCLLFASLLGAPTANAANGGRTASPAKGSSGVESASVPNGAATVPASARENAAERYGDLPLTFEPNQGQLDGQVRFVSRGSGYSFFLTQAGAVLSFSRDPHSDAVLRMQLAGASANANIEGLDVLPGKSNYFAGSDASRWRTGVPTYSRVKYENVYPGISLVYYGNQRQLEYDFVVAPGADPRQIRLSVGGAKELTVDSQGNLVLHNAAGEVQLLAPRVYQQIHGQKQEIAGQWTLEANNSAGFRLGAYDRTQPLVIDPVLMYSSFLGGSQKNVLSKIAIDAAGNAYVAGYTTSGDFPAAPTPLATTFGAGAQSRGAFVAKIDPTGSNLLYSTYLSGSSDEEATGLAIDKSGNVYVAGNTHSTDFPTRNALQSTCATHTQPGTCSSAFLTKISSTGDSLLFSTYLGGSGGESARGLAIDAAGSAYLAGVTSSVDFPVTSGAAQAKCGGACQQNAFVAKFSPAGDKLVYATYLGGSAVDEAADLAVDSTGNAYLAGHTTSADFPLASPFRKFCAADATNTSGACVPTAFVAKIKSDGSAFVYSTYLSGSLGSKASAVAVDSLGSAYVTGSTQSADFPVLNPFQKSCGIDAATGHCSIDAFVTKFAPTGKTVVYSTYLGGTGRDEPSGIAVDAAGNAHIVGSTESADFPTLASSQSKLKGSSDAFAARLNAAGTSLTFSTYHGGAATESGNSIALDAKGNIYLAGETSSPDFPTSHPFQSSCAGACTSAFITKMALLPPPVVAPPTIVKSFAPTTIPLNGTSTLTLTITNPGANVVALTGVAVSDTLPSGMSVATPDNLATSCGGTAADSGGVLSLTAGTIAVAASCTVTVDVNGTTSGNILNTTGTVSSTNGGTGLTANATLTVLAPPTIAKAFNPASIARTTGVSTLTLTITNPNTLALTGVAVSDPLPPGMVFASTPNLTNTCGGTPTAAAGSLSLTAGTIAASSNCKVTVDINANIAGAIVNTTGTVSSTNGGTGLTATDTLTVVAPPTITKGFNPASVALNTGVSTLTLTITNPAANTVALAGVAVSDTLPAGMVFASTPNLTNTCGGTPTAAAGVLSLTAGAIAKSGNCKVTVDVNATTAGTLTNTTGKVSSTNGGTGLTATADLGSAAPPTIAKAFGAATVVLGNSKTLTLTITNPNTTAMTGVAFTDSLPAGLTVTNPNGLVNTCNGTPSAVAGSSTVSLTAGTLAASGSCTLTVDVTGIADGAQNNTTGPVSATEGGTGLASNTATLTVQDFTWSISPTSATVIEGQSTTGGNSPVATAAPIDGYNQTITVVTPCVVSPPTVTITCTPSGTIANGSGSATVTINTTPATPVGTYAVTIEGTDASPVKLHYSKTFTLTVECTLTASAPTPILADAGTYALTVTETAGGTNCGWAATSDSPWITFPSGNTGINTGVGNQQTVSFNAATNYVNQAPTRTANLSVSEYPTEVVQPSTAVTQDDVLVTVPTFKTPSSCSVAAAPPVLHVNSGATACFTSTAVGTLGVGTATPGVNWATVGTGCGTGPCSGSIVSSTPIIGVYTAPLNIANSGAVYSGGQGSTTDGVQSSWTKYSPPPSGTPQVQQLANAVQIINDQPTCTGAPAVMADPLNSALTGGQPDPINNPVAVSVQHTCADNQDNENDLQSAAVNWGDTTAATCVLPSGGSSPSACTTFPTGTGVASGSISASHQYTAIGAYPFTVNPFDTSGATNVSASAQVTITDVASDTAGFQVAAGISSFKDLPSGSVNVTFPADPCAALNNADGFQTNGVIRSDGMTDSANFGITCSVAPSTSSALAATLTVNTTAATNPPLKSSKAKTIASLLVLSFGVPGLVLLGLGVSPFGSRRNGQRRRVACILGIVLMISALIFLPACGGGIHAPFFTSSNSNVVYFLTVTGTDSSGVQQTYIVPLTVTPAQ